MFRIVPKAITSPLLGVVAYSVWYICVALHKLLKLLEQLFSKQVRSPHSGKTVLVTTGRQAKTLHGVKALKEIGCRVIVTDYQEMSASAVSTACDGSAILAPLNPRGVGHWVDHLERIIRKEKVDLVLPMSTINEALFIGIAKDWLQNRLPNVQFACEGLDMMTRLDNKAQFDLMCRECGVPVPESGVATSRADLENGAIPFGEMDIIIKRIESSINREEEIKVVLKGQKVPNSVQPTPSDPWQWQRFIRGTEYSAWFVAVDGKITFQGCYRSESDLLFFDGIPVPEDVEKSIANLIGKYKLTGQYAFDYFREDSTGKFFVIECNPRASSVLEGVSGTPGWGASFFGDDVRGATQYQQVGFWFHRNCWPFMDRAEGFWSWTDPLPFFIAEFAWPLEMLRIKGALKGGQLSRSPKGIPIEAGLPLTAQFPTLMEAIGMNYHHLDVNIGKIIVPGPTVGRDYAYFEEIARDSRASFLRAQVRERGAAPSVLCANAEVALALVGMDGCIPNVTRMVQDEPDMMHVARVSDETKEYLILGSPRSTLQNLAKQSKTFDAIFLTEDLLAEIPACLIALGGRVFSVETLPTSGKQC